MLNFVYKARDDSGKLVKGVLAAVDEADLFNRLKTMGYFLTSSKASFTAPKAQSAAKEQGHFSQIELLNFTTQVAISLDAGIPLLTVLKDLGSNSSKKTVKFIVEDLARKVESGCTFKEALAAHPKSFSLLFVSIVGAGESTGKLAFVIEDLSKIIEWQLDLKSKVKEASIYPVILFTAMVGVVTVLMATVIPKFKDMFAELDVELPLATKVVLAASSVWWVPLVTIIIAVIVWVLISLKPKGRYQLDKFKLKIPVMGDLLTKIALSRFCHTFALGLRSGVNVFNALGIASEVTGNIYLAQSVAKAKDYVNVGEKISTALVMSSKDAGGKFPDIVIRMINVGEQTGNLANTLDKVNQYYDKEVPAAVKKIFALIEPVMILFMGVVVGGIALAVFLPLTKLISAVGGD
jgi:type IV pilus assembly protein PilC